MIAWILLVCIAAGVALYFGIVRPLVVPLSWRIPTGSAYRATLTHTRRHA